MATGKQLRAARERLKLSAARVAEKLGVSVNSVYAWESEASKPRDEKLQKKLHDMLGISAEGEKTSSPGIGKTAALAKMAKRAGMKVEKLRPASSVKEFFTLLAFVVKDPPRKYVFTSILQHAKSHGLSIDDLLHMLTADEEAAKAAG